MLKRLETAVNALLQSDPQLIAQLHKLDGKVLQFDFIDFTHRVTIKIENERILLLPSREVTYIDLTLRATPATLIQTVLQNELTMNGITLNGDASLAQELHKIAQSLDFDWQGMLAQRIGETPAYHLSMAARKLHHFARRTIENFKLDLTDYGQHETQALPHPVEIELFKQQVIECRDAVERLAARIAMLQKQKEMS